MTRQVLRVVVGVLPLAVAGVAHLAGAKGWVAAAVCVALGAVAWWRPAGHTPTVVIVALGCLWAARVPQVSWWSVAAAGVLVAEHWLCVGYSLLPSGHSRIDLRRVGPRWLVNSAAALAISAAMIGIGVWGAAASPGASAWWAPWLAGAVISLAFAGVTAWRASHLGVDDPADGSA